MMHFGHFPGWINGPAILFTVNNFIDLKKFQTIFKSIGAVDNVSIAIHNLDSMQSHDHQRFIGIFTKADCGTKNKG
jgi:hypothetical protein